MLEGATLPAAVTQDGRQGLNICLAAPLFSPDYSGAGLRFQRYAEKFPSRGVAMHVVAPAVGAWKRNRRYAGEGEGARVLPKPGKDLPVHRVPIPRRAGKWRTRQLFEGAVVARCQDETTRPDLVIWLGLSPYSVPNLIRLRRQRIPIVYAQTIVKELSGPGWKQWLKRRYWPLRYRYVDCVLVGSGTMRDNLRKLGVDTRIEVIPHGVDLERFRPPTVPPGFAPARQRLGLGADSELVLFVGPIQKRKGLDHLAAAWGRVAAERPHAHLVLVGPEKVGGTNGESFGEQLRATLSRGRGADRVTFVGPVDDPEEYFRAADLFVFPSRREGMPNVVCEAFASGVACILTPFLGLPAEFGRPDEQYVLVDHDADLLAESMSALLGDFERRQALGRAARVWAEEHLDLERIVDRLSAVCWELANGSHDLR